MQSVLHNVIGPKEVHPKNLQGRTAIVTGGPLGIGYEVSRALAHAGCKVLMVNRSEDEGQAAMDKIRQESPEADVDWRECDMGNLAQVKAVFSSIRDSLSRLDYLVLSAGLNANQYALDADGIERIFGVNYLGQYYVTNQLWPVLRKTSRMSGAESPRVVSVSSELHRACPSSLKLGSLEDINNSELNPAVLYGRTKLALILFAKFGLVEKVIKPSGDSIYALTVHPGAVNTAMQNQWKDAYPGITGQLISFAMKAISRDAEQGAYSTLWALTAPEVEEKQQNGAYYTDPGQLGKESSQASDKQLGEELWELSEKLITDKLGRGALVDWKGC
ncbi:hypothetical protein CDD80_3886 [Ophiocordyceps camponoti-rufipedis]|uniref:Uncharacterized protein n=1 Tax=Ophiocordyceps camponoti-rufipedis TaxID=2004952 RepID=A0A2C5Z0F5_9HYPO|nr:hypothetical protein CDD80_3886 [Ophiocordyceps camponoti-rufipedis]